jgi:hypothetical protein
MYVLLFKPRAQHRASDSNKFSAIHSLKTVNNRFKLILIWYMVHFLVQSILFEALENNVY